MTTLKTLVAVAQKAMADPTAPEMKVVAQVIITGELLPSIAFSMGRLGIWKKKQKKEGASVCA